MYRVKYEFTELFDEKVGNIVCLSIENFVTISAAQSYAAQTYDMYKKFEDAFDTWFHQETQVIRSEPRGLAIELFDLIVLSKGTNKKFYKSISEKCIGNYL